MEAHDDLYPNVKGVFEKEHMVELELLICLHHIAYKDEFFKDAVEPLQKLRNHFNQKDNLFKVPKKQVPQTGKSINKEKHNITVYYISKEQPRLQMISPELKGYLTKAVARAITHAERLDNDIKPAIKERILHYLVWLQ